MKEEYTIENVTRTLKRYPGIKISGTSITIAKDAAVGIKTWGKIDFLIKNGYIINKIDKLDKEVKAAIDIDNEQKGRREEFKDKLIPKVKIPFKKK